MKKHLLVATLLFAGLTVKSQCTFIGGNTDSLDNYLADRSLTWGSMPDTTQNLPLATANQLYDATIELKWASNTNQLSSSAPSIPVNGIKITSITGLPPGLTFISPSSTADDVYCDGQGASATNCDWPGNSYACIKVSGTPTAVGTYPLNVNLEVAHFGGPSAGTFAGFRIVVQPVGVDEFDENAFKVKQNIPNPFSDITQIKYTVKQSSNAKFYVMNLLGEIVYNKTFEAREGENTINFNGSTLNEGIYMYTIEINNKKVTKRMIIK